MLLEAVSEARRLDARRCLAELLRSVASVRALRGDFASARTDLAEAAGIFASVGADESGGVNVSWNLADLEFLAGDVKLALRHATDAVQILRAMNDTQNLSGLLITMSTYHIALDQYDASQACACEALDVAHEHRLPVDVARALHCLTAVAAVRPYETRAHRADAHRRAARLLGFARARLDAPKSAEPAAEDGEHDRVFIVLRDSLGTDELVNLMTVGTAMTEEEAIATAQPAEGD